MAPPNSTSDPMNLTAVYGIILRTGCFLFIFAIGTVLAGLLIDQVLGTGRIATIVLILVGLPINLFVNLRIARHLSSKHFSRSTDSPDAPASQQ
jgi:hypothetical protein